MRRHTINFKWIKIFCYILICGHLDKESKGIINPIYLESSFSLRIQIKPYSSSAAVIITMNKIRPLPSRNSQPAKEMKHALKIQIQFMVVCAKLEDKCVESYGQLRGKKQFLEPGVELGERRISIPNEAIRLGLESRRV